MRLFFQTCFWFCFLPISLTNFAFASDPSELAKLPEWQRLMHYKKHFLFSSKVESAVDGSSFFFAPDGKFNPEAELIASRDAMGKDILVGKLKQKPHCAFPARYRFLKRVFDLKIDESPCEKLQEFLGNFSAESATLVFSSAYPNNPGSMFGHTFLRINAKRDQNPNKKKLDILDYGISYAAFVREDENVLLYMVLGLFGGYTGQFSMQPYYAKVSEYSNGESRDVWEYDLDLTSEQTALILEHFWEIETNSYLDYFFFDENCAYQLLEVINVARPDWDFGRFGPYVTPAESVKRLIRIPGAVTGVHFRPSLRKRLLRAHSLLTKKQQSDFEQLQLGTLKPGEVESAATLDVFSLYLLYAKAKQEGELTQSQKQLQRETLVNRSQMQNQVGLSADELDWSDVSFRETQPELGHPSYRLGIASGMRDRLNFQELNFKFALHDLLNVDQGYSPFSQIDFPGFKFRVGATEPGGNSKLRLESLDFVAVTSLHPWTFLDRRFSWSTNLSYLTPRDLDCRDCRVLHFDAGGGVTFPILEKNWIVYGLVSLQTQAGSAITPFFRIGPRMELATLAQLNDRSKIQLSYRGVSDFFQSQRRSFYSLWSLNGSYSFHSNWELRLGLEKLTFEPNRDEWKLGVNYYF